MWKCGLSKALSQTLSNHFDVTVIPLNVELLRKKESKAAQSHLKKICDELQAFDYVNIQFEAGLYGINYKKIYQRFFKIAKSCKKLVLTMHRVDYKIKYPGCFLWKKYFKRKLPSDQTSSFQCFDQQQIR